jgi:hypothetical protein
VTVSDPLLTWTAHPARSRPRDVALVVAIVCTTAGVVMWTFESAWLALLAAVFLLLSVSSFLLPTRYRVTDEGIEAARALVVRRRRFADLRRLEVGADAALVSPLSRPSFLDRQRGLWIWLDGADRERVLGLLRDKIPSERAKQK